VVVLTHTQSEYRRQSGDRGVPEESAAAVE
jgi:hypothetical protein